MSREDALAELKVRFGEEPDGSDPRQAGAKRGFVLAVNVSAECRELMNILGVDKFVKVHGDVDLAGLEVAPLPERNLPPLERRRLILEAHEHLVEIDKRNEAQFGAFLKSLSNELAKEGIR